MLRVRVHRTPRLLALTCRRDQGRRGYPNQQEQHNYQPQEQQQQQPQQGDQYSQQQYQQPQQQQQYQPQQQQYQPQQQQYQPQQHQYQQPQQQPQQQQPQQQPQQHQYQQSQQQQQQQQQQQYQQQYQQQQQYSQQYPHQQQYQHQPPQPYQQQQQQPFAYHQYYSTYPFQYQYSQGYPYTSQPVYPYPHSSPPQPTQHFRANYPAPSPNLPPPPPPPTPPPQPSQSFPPPAQQQHQTQTFQQRQEVQTPSRPFPSQPAAQPSQPLPSPPTRSTYATPPPQSSQPSQTPQSRPSQSSQFSQPPQTSRPSQTPPQPQTSQPQIPQPHQPLPLKPLPQDAPRTRTTGSFSFNDTAQKQKPAPPPTTRTPTPTTTPTPTPQLTKPPTSATPTFTPNVKTQAQPIPRATTPQTPGMQAPYVPPTITPELSLNQKASFANLISAITAPSKQPQKPKQSVNFTASQNMPPGSQKSAITDILGALSSATANEQQRKYKSEEYRQHRESRVADRTKKALERREQIIAQRKQKLGQRPKLTAEFFERQIRESRNNVKARHMETEYQIALKNVLYVAERLSPEFDVLRRFAVPQHILDEFATSTPIIAAQPERVPVPTLPRAPDSDISENLASDAILEEFAEREQLARLRGRNDLTTAEKDELRELEQAHERLTQAQRKALQKEADARAEIKDAVPPEVRAEKIAQYDAAHAGEDASAGEFGGLFDEFADYSKENFPNESAYMGELNLFFLAQTLGERTRVSAEDLAQVPEMQDWYNAIVSLAPSEPPARPTTRNGEVLTDVALSVRAPGTLLEPYMKMMIHPIALAKYHDLMATEDQERFNDQLFMYKAWQDSVETLYYGPVLWANSYLRQILPKLRKLQSKRDAQFQMDNRSRMISRTVQARRAKEGTLIVKKPISPRNMTENYKTLNPIVEPELILRKPVFVNAPGREALFNSVASAVLKNPSYTMKQKRGLITRWGYGLQHMGVHQVSKLTPEERDERLKEEFKRENRAKKRKAKKRPIRMEKRAIERKVLEDRMYYIPSVDYNLDDMDRRNQRSIATL